jgi:hypothetical protein
MKQVNERTSVTLSMQFTSELGVALTPNSGRYQIVDEMSGTILTPWTAFTPTTSTYDLAISQTNNQIIDPSRDLEVRIVTIVFQYDSSTKQGTGEFKYEVKNLFDVPPGITLTSTGGFIAGGTSPWVHS